MKETRVRSVTVEVESEQGGSSIVVREPFGRSKVFVAGPAGASEVTSVLDRLGLSGSQGVQSPHSLRPSIMPSSSALAADSQTPSSIHLVDGTDELGLAAELEKLAEAILRGGLAAESSSTDEALDDLFEIVRGRELEAVARLLSAVERAVEDHSAAELAMALAALAHAVDALRGPRSELQVELCGAGPDGCQDLSGLELVEVGRTRQRDALSVETRLLVDLSTGEMFREVACVGRGLSHGQSGRKLVVDLGQRLISTDPSRLLVHQYEMRPLASQQELERALSDARRDMSVPPGLARDPLRLVYQPLPVILAPAGIVVERGERLYLVDESSRRLAVIAPSSGAAPEALAELVERGPAQPPVLVGSMVTDSSGIGFCPWTAWVAAHNGLEPRQLSL